ncbi:hypothetical protein EX227_03475 [Providencia rettgeri]|uniref:Uncharacterized protein n=3 Tax=Providencia rettgeri TaxID=587 RepID=A0AAP2NV77_PRORE|nr:hypothetical protein [Providencia rettgeri]MBX6956588.1 hypothetical protein [Providencia rettgeri]MBX6960362.1 hypothetical protein [Providencia rettgeri]MBX6970780.1 hypothetical protein [Providencia rettgeri]MBX6979981.1 hypothetical protein [Providencia rettgeri]MBX6983950.1 hypothetical protein [Providencia rettgeri]
MSFFIFLFLAISIIGYEAGVSLKQIFQKDKKKNKDDEPPICFIDNFSLKNKKIFNIFITLVLVMQICVCLYLCFFDSNLIDNLIRNNLEPKHITREASHAIMSFIILISIALIMFPYLSRNKIENSSYKYICLIENISVISFIFFLGYLYFNCIENINEGRKDLLFLMSTILGALSGIFLNALFSFFYDASFWCLEIKKDSCFFDNVEEKKIGGRIMNTLDILKINSKYIYLVSIIVFAIIFFCLSILSESFSFSNINEGVLYFLLGGLINYALTKYYENP